MIHRLQRGLVPPKPHTVLRVDGALAFEHCFTRKGFEGAYTIMYHRTPPHWLAGESDAGEHPGWAEASADPPIRRRHFRTAAVPPGGEPMLGRRLLVANRELGVWLGRPDRDDATLVANADGDELTFVHEGAGRVETPLGVLDFEAGDYVFVPRSLLHRWRLDRPAHLLTIEARSWVDLPRQFRNPVGQLTMDAPYSHRDFREPRWPEGGPATLGVPREALVHRQGRLSRFEYAHDPFDVVGWDGQVWPFAFPIHAYQPKTGLVHLPPTIHITFAGQGFVVCSFVPRVVDFHPEAIPCPYPHSSVDCDEIIFYAAGNFTSRRGIEPASVTLHPCGVPHGPHPGRYEASIGTARTSELAVMIDTFSPLGVTAHARAVEDVGYNRSWASADDSGVLE
ncbi:MAG TPA: homogentisate 1,2-dioxygenase [Thermoanaerobaculaceae bacterium]|nr:homogentisate 1,2-dioxygenase [Thermoanaerobaculaceae bacterium]HRS15300.1 homogentisate 1,2-dioxygenase [Thermoanaerobaculaceae bacterium]